MAAETVISAFLTVIEKTPSQYPRSCKLREWGKEILAKAGSEDDCFDKFSTEVVVYLQNMVSSTANKYKLTSSKRDRLWRKFHMVRIKGKLSSLLKIMIEKLNVNITDCLLEQSLYQEIFELCLREYFYDIDSNSSSGAASNTGFDDVILSTDELNIMRYVSVYIA